MNDNERRSVWRPAIAGVLPWMELLSRRRFVAAAILALYEVGVVVLWIHTLGMHAAAGASLPRDIISPLAILTGASFFIRVFAVVRFLRPLAGGEALESHGRVVLRRLMRDAKGIFGLAVLLLLVYLAVAAPLLAGDPMVMVFSDTLQGPSGSHLLGTDLYGRDVFSRIAYGARTTLGIGLAATFLNILLGTTLGLVAGFFRGAADAIIMRLLEILNSIPFLMLAILIVAVFGSSVPMLIVVLSVFVLQPARIVRGQVLDLREKEYVKAAVALGAHPARVLFRHILPNMLSTILVVASIRVGQNILSLAGLSFLGMGISPPTPSWGSMLQEGRAYIQGAPWLGIFPGLAIFITVLAFNLFGDGLRDALDPRLRGSS